MMYETVFSGNGFGFYSSSAASKQRLAIIRQYHVRDL
jgi:hypothetical protein